MLVHGSAKPSARIITVLEKYCKHRRQERLACTHFCPPPRLSPSFHAAFHPMPKESSAHNMKKAKVAEKKRKQRASQTAEKKDAEKKNDAGRKRLQREQRDESQIETARASNAHNKRISRQGRDDNKIKKDRNIAANSMRLFRGRRNRVEIEADNAAAANGMRTLCARRQLELPVIEPVIESDSESDSESVRPGKTKGDSKSANKGSKKGKKASKTNRADSESESEWWHCRRLRGCEPRLLSHEEIVKSDSIVRGPECNVCHLSREPLPGVIPNRHTYDVKKMDVLQKGGVWDREPFINLHLESLFRRVTPDVIDTIPYLTQTELTELCACLAMYHPGLTIDDMITELLPHYDRFLMFFKGGWGESTCARKEWALYPGHPVPAPKCPLWRSDMMLLPSALLLGCACNVEEGRECIMKMGRCACMTLSLSSGFRPEPGYLEFYTPSAVQAVLGPADICNMWGTAERGGYFFATDRVGTCGSRKYFSSCKKEQLEYAKIVPSFGRHGGDFGLPLDYALTIPQTGKQKRMHDKMFDNILPPWVVEKYVCRK